MTQGGIFNISLFTPPPVTLVHPLSQGPPTSRSVQNPKASSPAFPLYSLHFRTFLNLPPPTTDPSPVSEEGASLLSSTKVPLFS